MTWSALLLRAVIAAGSLAGRGPKVDGQRLDAHMAAVLRGARRMNRRRSGGGPPSLAGFRAQYAAGPALTGLALDRSVTTEEIAGPVPLRRYRPSGVIRGGLIWFHGGGFIIGSLETHDRLCRVLARETQRVVLAVDYRLAPEHPFPAAYEDSLAVVRAARVWLPEGDVVVGGDSAGANLTAASLLAIGQAEAKASGIVGQLLLYPVVDMAGDYPSQQMFADGYLLTAAGMEECARLLLPTGFDRTDPRVSPIRGDLAGVPPALVIAAGFDPLRDQAVAYVAALDAAGVRASLVIERGLVHGFADFAGVVPAAKSAVLRAATSLNRFVTPTYREVS